MYSLIQLFIYGFIEIYFIFWGNKVLSFVVQIVPALAIVKSSLCHFDIPSALCICCCYCCFQYFLIFSHKIPQAHLIHLPSTLALESVLSLRGSACFCWRMVWKPRPGALSVLIAIRLLLLMGPFRGQSRELCVPVLYVTICICARLNMSIPVSPALTH